MTSPNSDVTIAPGPLLFVGELMPSHPHPPSSISLVVTGVSGAQTIQLPATPAGDYEGTFTFSATGTFEAVLEVNGLSSATRTITVSNPPALSISVEPAPPRPDSWPRPEVWRRDESPHARLDSDAPLASTTLTLGGSTAGVTATSNDGCEWAAPCDGGTCFCYTLDLGAPSFEQLEGDLPLGASGVDTHGLSAVASGTLPATRLRWIADTGAGVTLAGSPAVTFDGYVVANASGASNGTYVFSPDGVELYGAVNPDEFAASPMLVSFFEGTPQTISVLAPSFDPGDFYSARIFEITCLDGYAWRFCYDTGFDQVFGGPMIQTPAAWMTRWGAVWETGASDLFGTPARLAGYSLFGTFFWELPGGASTVTPSAGIVTDESTFYAIDAAGSVTGVHLGGSFPNEAFDGVSFTSPPLGADVISGQMLLRRPDGGQLLVRSVTGCDGGCASVAAFATPGTPSAPEWSAAAGSAHGPVALDESAVFFTTDEPPQLVRVDHGNVVAAAALPAPSVGSPVLGEGGLLYLVTASGALEVFDTATLQPRWQGAATGLSATSSSSAALDCNRLGPDGGIATGSGSLYFFNGSQLISVVVDSPNLEPTAQWPKYQHDVQNTGNVTQPRNAGCP